MFYSFLHIVTVGIHRTDAYLIFLVLLRDRFTFIYTLFWKIISGPVLWDMIIIFIIIIIIRGVVIHCMVMLFTLPLKLFNYLGNMFLLISLTSYLMRFVWSICTIFNNLEFSTFFMRLMHRLRIFRYYISLASMFSTRFSTKSNLLESLNKQCKR